MKVNVKVKVTGRKEGKTSGYIEARAGKKKYVLNWEIDAEGMGSYDVDDYEMMSKWPAEVTKEVKQAYDNTMVRIRLGAL